MSTQPMLGRQRGADVGNGGDVRLGELKPPPLVAAKEIEGAAEHLNMQFDISKNGKAVYDFEIIDELVKFLAPICPELLARSKQKTSVTMDNLRELFRQHSQERAGWVLVPKEPTDEQLLRMFRAFHADKPEILEEVMGMSDLSDHQAQLLQDGYCEALAAAPLAGSGEKP